MGATHHLHPNVRFLQLQSSDEKSTVRSDRKSLIKLKANRMVSLFLLSLIGYLYEFRMTYEGFFIETKERLCYPQIV